MCKEPIEVKINQIMIILKSHQNEISRNIFNNRKTIKNKMAVIFTFLKLSICALE
jgi:hypothetical protein